VKILISKNN